MKNLTSPIAIPNVTKWQLLDDYRPNQGTGTLRVYYGSGQTRWADFDLVLSDTAAASVGIGINPNPARLDDTIAKLVGVGSANALTNARNAYRNTAGNNNTVMSAVEASIQTDGVVQLGAVT